MNPFGLKLIFITFIIFVPLERLLALRKQSIFRVGFGNDLIFCSSLDCKIGILSVLFVSTLAAGELPESVQSIAVLDPATYRDPAMRPGAALDPPYVSHGPMVVEIPFHPPQR